MNLLSMDSTFVSNCSTIFFLLTNISYWKYEGLTLDTEVVKVLLLKEFTNARFDIQLPTIEHVEEERRVCIFPKRHVHFTEHCLKIKGSII